MKKIILILSMLLPLFAMAQPVSSTITSDGSVVTIATPVNSKQVPVCNFNWIITDGNLKMWITGSNEIIPGGRLKFFTVSGVTDNSLKDEALGAISYQCSIGGGSGLDSLYSANGDLIENGDTLQAGIDSTIVRNDSVFVVSGGEEIFTGNSVAEPSQQVAYGNSGGNGVTSSPTFIKEATRITINNGSTSANLGLDRIPTPAATLPKGTSVSLYESAAYVAGARRTISRIETRYNAWGNDRYANLEIGVGSRGTTYGGPSIRVFSDSLLSTVIKPVVLGWDPGSLLASQISSHVTILGRSLTKNVLEVADYSTTKDLLLEVGLNGNIVSNKYGVGNKEASDLVKIQSAYIAGFATDGTMTEVRMPNGIYTPTITKNTATDTIITINTFLYSSNDSILNITGEILLNTLTSTTTSSIQISLPPGITSDFTDADNDASGYVGMWTKAAIPDIKAAWVKTNTTNNTIVLHWVTDAAGGNQEYLSLNINCRIK